MKTEITAQTPSILRAAEILETCVHCGFCTATCPSYQVQGDELDSPRGRIYLIKEMLERQSASTITRVHLDRCLMCRSCETTCPSGVRYAELLAIGKRKVQSFVPYSLGQKFFRHLVSWGLSNRRVFAFALRIGQFFRPFLPRRVQLSLPLRKASLATTPSAVNIRESGEPDAQFGLGTLILFEGCVQSSLRPEISVASRLVLEAVGYQVITVPALECCGAVAHHLEQDTMAHRQMRRNIDVLWPLLNDSSTVGVVFDASGCGLMLTEYAAEFATDPVYSEKAKIVAQRSRDVSSWLLPHIDALKKRTNSFDTTLAYHPPCTLQHGLKQKDQPAFILRALGAKVFYPADSHLCCGSAGTYSLFQPEIATQLRARKIENLQAIQASCIVSANIGCIHYLGSASQLPVKHWIELVGEKLTANV